MSKSLWIGDEFELVQRKACIKLAQSLGDCWHDDAADGGDATPEQHREFRFILGYDGVVEKRFAEDHFVLMHMLDPWDSIPPHKRTLSRRNMISRS